MIDAARLAVDEIAGMQCSVIDLQYAVEEMQFFNARMCVAGIIGSRIQPDQQAYAVVVPISREYFDVDTWRGFLPLWFNRPFQGRYKRPRSLFTGDSLLDAAPQRFRGTQDIGGPADKGTDYGPERLDFLPAIVA